MVIWVEWQCGHAGIVVGKRPELSGMSGAEAADGAAVVAVAAVTGVAVTNGGSSPNNVVVFAEPTF